MAGFNQVFKRAEVKYMLTEEQYQLFRKGIEPYMQVDAYGLSTIMNLYLDTDDYDLIRTSLDKPRYKEKLRLRSYGVPKEDSKVFLEIKKKYAGIVYKRREVMTEKEAMDYLTKGILPAIDTQIMREIDWCMKLYKPVPKLFLAYDRVALFGKEDSELRMTFDQNIRYRRHDLDLTHGDRGTLFTQPDQHLLEIKVPGAYPLWLSSLLSELGIFPTSFSKYGAIYGDLAEVIWHDRLAGIARRVPDTGDALPGLAALAV